MGYFLAALGVVLVIIGIFILIPLFSGNMTNVYYFVLIFGVIGLVIGIAVISGKK